MMDGNEIVDGAVSEVHEFGAFVRIGPMEALLHKSQILDEQIDINVGLRRIEGRQSGKYLAEGTAVRARIVSLSLNPRSPLQQNRFDLQTNCSWSTRLAQ